MKEGVWYKRWKRNGIIYKRGGIVQMGDGGEGVDQVTKVRLPTTARALTGESQDTPDVSREAASEREHVRKQGSWMRRALIDILPYLNEVLFDWV